jgi:CheY-like chemotaxis protein
MLAPTIMALRLLIVDDNAHFLEAARDLLEQEGMAVVAVASTGAEALERSAELRPDVALVDVDLGDESGFDLARGLVQASSGDRLRVVLISTHAEDDLRDLVESSPAVGFLSKLDLSGQAIRQLLAASGSAVGHTGEGS